MHGDNFQTGLNLTSKGGKGITASLSAVGVSRPIMGEMLLVDGVIPTVIMAENRVGLGSATLLVACQREHQDHGNGDENSAANSYSNNDSC